MDKDRTLRSYYLVEKIGQYGKFYGCSNYPKFKFIKK